MKTTNTPKISSIFKPDSGEQPVRLIKASQAGKLLGGHAHASAHAAQPKPEIRLIKAGADYCDLEITCGCGESTQVRCWNAPAANASTAVAA
jgi:hypothetical protein